VQPKPRGHGRIVVNVIVQPAHPWPLETIPRQQHGALGDIAIGAVATPQKQDAERRSLLAQYIVKDTLLTCCMRSRPKNSGTAVSDMIKSTTLIPASQRDEFQYVE